MMTAASVYAARRPRTSSRQAFWLHPPVMAVIGATVFNFLLCLVNTNVSTVGSAAAIGCELVIISAVLFYAYRSLNYTQFIVICAAILYLVMLSAGRLLLTGAADIKAVRDLVIPIAFFVLGAATPDLKTADRIVRTVALLVVAIGLFEYLLPDVFTRFCNVAGFYVERGTMKLSQAQQSSDLFVSGLRPEGAGGGRNILPFLGNHRVSSIFLEPVSAGNFGIIVFLWALVRSKMERRLYWGMIIAAATVIVMSDSRFGAYFCAICLTLSLIPAAIRLAMVAVAPLVGVLVILVVPGLLPIHFGIDNGFIGRIIMSGEILDRFDGLNWFGLRGAAFMTADSGYAYTIASVGVIGIALFWGMLLLTAGRNRFFYLFRDLAAAYVAFLLCISNSPYTIKTGALLWFLTGALSAVVTKPAPRASTVSTESLQWTQPKAATARALN